MSPALASRDLRQAVVLAGGRGERLRPLTDTRPKPMIEFNGRPFLEYLVEQIREEGFEEILLRSGGESSLSLALAVAGTRVSSDGEGGSRCRDGSE